MTFSIIIPIYQVRDYIDQCIESVLNQYDQEFEIILVDDGSSDGSAALCDAWAAKDPKITVIHKANEGVSVARNVGIMEATGRYIVFLDGDDWMADGALAHAKALLKENPVDVLMMSLYQYWHQEKNVILELIRFDPTIPGEAALDIMADLFYKNQRRVWGVCRHVFSRAFLEKHQLRFPRELVASEDCEFFIQCMLHAEKVAVDPYPFYYYRIGREGSVITEPSEKSISDFIQTDAKWLKYFSEHQTLDEHRKRQICTVFSEDMVDIIPLIATMRKEIGDALMKTIALREIRYLAQRRLKIKRAMYLTLGLKPALALMSVYSRIAERFG